MSHVFPGVFRLVASGQTAIPSNAATTVYDNLVLPSKGIVYFDVAHAHGLASDVSVTENIVNVLLFECQYRKVCKPDGTYKFVVEQKNPTADTLTVNWVIHTLIPATKP